MLSPQREVGCWWWCSVALDSERQECVAPGREALSCVAPGMREAMVGLAVDCGSSACHTNGLQNKKPLAIQQHVIVASYVFMWSWALPSLMLPIAFLRDLSVVYCNGQKAREVLGWIKYLLQWDRTTNTNPGLIWFGWRQRKRKILGSII